jgi:hypothetical protein
MSTAILAIRSVRARAVVAPIARPVKNAFGVIEAAPLVLIDVKTDQGVTGRSYIFAYAPLTLKPLVLLIEQIGRDLTGKPIAPFDLMAAMDAKFRLLGWQGLVGMAVSGLDMAFWDALGQAAGEPLAVLLGGSTRPMRAYDSYGVVDPKADARDLKRSLDQGFKGIKIKGGDGDAANDERVVSGVRDLIGPDIALMIDFNQSLDPAEAISRIERLEPYDLHWIEEPVAQENLLGHAKVRVNVPDPDSGRRELVVSARLCRSDRGWGFRFHHAGSNEMRRRQRLAPHRRTSRSRLDSDVQSPVCGSEFSHAGGNADGALARGSGPCPRRSGRADPDRRRRGDRARPRPWAVLGRDGGNKISGVNDLLRRHRPRKRTIQYSAKSEFPTESAAYWMPRLRGA